MRQIIVTLSALVAVSFFTACDPYGGMTPDERTAAQLAERIVPEYASDIVFCQIEDSLDVFELSWEQDGLVIKGNNANSMAVGLNHYLRNFCDVTVSWYASEPVQCPDEMPGLTAPVRVEARTPNRFFLNYCTFGYTMPWWKWEDWERFIDWMALNGVNMPLANTGQEAVWQKVWTNHGLTDEQIRSYFTGPAHLAWHRMSNIDHFDGPLPQNWIDSQVELQKKILERERALNMRPVLSAFNGHVPEQMKDIYPDADITDMNGWAGFPKENLCHFLSPTDPLFARIQKEFMQEQESLFGTDHIYGVDLFNEVDAPSWDPQTLAAISEAAYASMASVDPEAVWLQMGWMFHYDRKHWTPENIKAYLQAVPQGKVVILDYYMEHTPVWKNTEKFYGQPYILCYLGNFGGNVWMTGDYHQASLRIEEAFADGGENFAGLGSTLEGFGVNMFMYESVLDKAWNTGLTDKRWVRNLADRTAGHPDKSVRRALRTLTDSIYVAGSYSGQTPLACARPCLDGFWHWTAIHNTRYDNRALVRAWRDLLEASSDRDSYRSLVVATGVQALGNHFVVMRDSLAAAYRAGDLAETERVGVRITEALSDLDALAACDPQLRLDRWLADASACAQTPQEAEYYRRNARTIITTWGVESSIRDYAARAWSGLIDSYYAPRWQMFIDELTACLKEGRTYDEKVFFERLTAFENAWTSDDSARDFRPVSDYMELSKTILGKYFGPAPAAPRVKDWARFNKYEKANSEVSTKPWVVIMGDSITEGWVEKDPGFFPENNILGRGISGQTTSHMLVRFRRDVIDHAPEYVVILAGTNDIAENNGYITLENIFGNIVSMCELAECNGITPVICSVLPASRYGWRPQLEDVAVDVMRLNDMLRAYARDKGYVYVDYHTLFKDEDDGLPKNLAPDGIHPNLDCYKVMESILLETLR